MGTRRAEANVPKKGMNRNNHPSEISESEYTFALNANIQSAQGESDLIITNEPSNLKCTGFKEGYKVVFHKYDRVSNRTYFFIVNQTTGCSEIGFINMNIILEPSEIELKECNCVLSVVIEDGLENITQEGSCVYNTIISDYCKEIESCTGCLGFSLENPITNVSIRHSKSGDELYFSQKGKPTRYIKLDYIEEYFQNIDDCTGEIENVCLKCDDILIFNKFDFPCIKPVTVSVGGSLKAGIYEVALAYSDLEGYEVTDYIAFTNYVQIIDYNNNILDQTSLDYNTNQSISLDISGLDESYDYYKLVVIFRSGNETMPQYIPYGIFPISDDNVVISQLPFISESERLTATQLLSQRTTYLTADGIVDANGYLFQHTLTAQKTINLQPVVSMMGGFVKWGTGIAREKLYQNGVASALYKTYNRWEVHPLSIQFKMKGGHKTDNFLFIPRPPRPDEVSELTTADKNFASVTAETSLCADIERNKKWQFYDTATVDGVFTNCFDQDGSTTKEIITQEFECESDVYVIENGSVTNEFNGSIVAWINQNRDFILSSTDPRLADIKDALTNGSYYEDCDVDIPDTCSEPELVSSVIVAVDVDGQEMEYDSVPYDQYDPVFAPDNCGSCTDSEGFPTECGYLVEPQTHDISIEDVLRNGATVWEKVTPNNSSCSSALEATPIGTAAVGSHLVDMGQIGGFNTLLTSTPVSLTDNDFKPFLHSNAVFHKVSFVGEDKVAVQLTNINCISTDDNTNNKVRVTVFSGSCGSLTEVVGVGKIVSDMTTSNDPQKFFVLDPADVTTTSPTLFIAVDSPMFSEYEVTISLSGNNGEATLEILGETYTAVFDTDLSTTLTNFNTSSVSGWDTQNIEHSFISGELKLRMSKEQYNSLTSTTTVEDLVINIATTNEFHTLQPPCGCHAFFKQTAILENVTKYESISFVKQMVFKSDCEVSTLNVDDCGISPREYGKFSHWESSLKYPCNSELYDSSSLEIEYSDIPSGIRDDFEEYYTNGLVGNIYDLSGKSNFMDKPIRHYRFPSNITSPFMGSYSDYSTNFDNQMNSVIYPIGFVIDNDVINTFLDIAVKNNLITQEERDNITGYEIFRGDRAGNKTVIARGLGFSMMRYVDRSNNNSITYYPNFPLNDSSINDTLNSGLALRDTTGTHFTFHSPDTHFNRNIGLSNEILLEGYQRGVAFNSFAPLKGHPKYTVLGRKSIRLSKTLAGFETTAEIAQIVAQLLTDGAAGTWVVVSVVAAAVGITSALITLPFKYNSYRYEWNDIFENLGTGYNHAYIGLSEGRYFSFVKNTTAQNSLRGASIISYLQPGLKVLTKETTGSKVFVNNFQRENSIFIKIGNNFGFTQAGGLVDNSRLNIPTTESGKLGLYNRRTFSPYLTLFQYLPAQYGSVNSIKWLSTGYCGDLSKDNKCDIIFGGDIYISRFALKRKFPFFTATAYGLSSKDPFKYSSYFNINTGLTFNRGYLDYKTKIDEFGTGAKLPFVESAFSLWNGVYWVTEGSNNEFYIKDDNKFLTHYFGMPYFLAESEINCWNRYAGVELHEHFYPQVGDTLDWVQEENVRISEAEQFRYNFIYSSKVHRKNANLLPVGYSKELWDKKDDLTNTIIYSHKDSDDAIKRSPWLNYSALDTHTFSRKYGELVDVTAIESEQLLIRFTDGFEIYNSVDFLRDRLTSSNYELGIGGIFQQRAVSFNSTDLGHAGTQHKAIVSTPFGHVWVDAKRGKVFILQPGGKGMDELSVSMDKWFKEQLPFKILKKYPNVNVDRVYNGIGVTLGYDDRGKRVFLTKLDYIPLRDDMKWSEGDGFYIETPDGNIKIHYSNEEYFKKAYFTIAFSFISESWVSYYSFHPNYYNSLIDFFQTGVNFSNETVSEGLWTHNPMISSYQVFYGKKYPFEIEYPLKSNGASSFLENVSFYLETRKYYNYYDSVNIFGKGFNKSYIYNHFQHSGLLNLVKQESNNMQQWSKYPKYNSDSIDVLQSETEIGGYWSFNNILNHVKNERSGLPIFLNDDVNVGKEVNSLAMDYRKSLKDRIRGDYFLVRLIQDDFTQYKMLFKLGKVNRQYYG